MASYGMLPIGFGPVREINGECGDTRANHILGHGLAGPVDLAVVLALDVTLLEGQRLLRRLDEGGHVLSRVLGALGDELLVEAAVLALLSLPLLLRAQ